MAINAPLDSSFMFSNPPQSARLGPCWDVVAFRMPQPLVHGLHHLRSAMSSSEKKRDEMDPGRADRERSPEWKKKQKEPHLPASKMGGPDGTDRSGRGKPVPQGPAQPSPGGAWPTNPPSRADK